MKLNTCEKYMAQIKYSGNYLIENKVHFTSRSARDTGSDILKKKLSNKAWLINTGLNIVFELNQQKNKEAQRKHDCSERNSMFLTAAVTAFF